MIELVGISKRFGELAALDDVTLSFATGRTTVLLGPSGCGKTTLLRTLVGLVIPDAGRIVIAGTPLDRSSLPALRRRIGYVIQQGGLFPHMTARQNMTLVAKELDWTAGRIDARTEELRSLTHLPAAALDRYPGELSGGQNQRVALARGLFMNPDVLLLDEPLGALDPMIRHDLQQELREIFAKLAKTVVMVTHDLAEAAHFAHRIVLMRNGRVVQAGTARQLLDAPVDEFAAHFVRAQRGAQLHETQP
ncbi:MAG: ATP-binding cassette domain-containing protein [Steroidobacteraceae bacterium]